TSRRSLRRSCARSTGPRPGCAGSASPTPASATTATSPASSCCPPSWAPPSSGARRSTGWCVTPGSASRPWTCAASSPVPSPCPWCPCTMAEPWRPAPAEPWRPGPELDRVAHLDHDRAARRGYPEAVLCEPKTVAQVAAIAAEVGAAGTPTLFTRASAEQAAAVLAELPDAHHVPDARMVVWPAEPPGGCGHLRPARGPGG